MKIANILFNTTLIIVSAYFFYESFSFPEGADIGGIGPAFFPRLMLALVIILCAFNVVAALIKKEDGQFFEGVTKRKAIDFGVVLGSMLLMIFLLGKMPFILIAAIMLFIQCYILKLKLVTSLLTSVVLSVSVYLIFVKGFSILL